MTSTSPLTRNRTRGAQLPPPAALALAEQPMPGSEERENTSVSVGPEAACEQAGEPSPSALRPGRRATGSLRERTRRSVLATLARRATA